LNDAICAWCEAPRQTGPVCPRCGADYAKAAAIKAHGKAEIKTVAEESVEEPALEIEEPVIPVNDPAFECLVCLVAMPSMLFIAWLVQVTGFLKGMQRIFFGMPVHEFGHAVSAWLCGFNAIPALWKTITPENRGYISSALLLVAQVALSRYAIKHRQPAWFIGIAMVFLVQVYGTFVITLSKANMFITLGGDALGLVLSALLMSLFYVGKDTQIYKGALRYGFLGIGAAAFMDMFLPWWKKDISAIGYGLTGGIPTDSWKMVNIHLWEWESLFSMHFTIGFLCLLALITIYALGIRQANLWLREKQRHDRLEQLRKASVQHG